MKFFPILTFLMTWNSHSLELTFKDKNSCAPEKNYLQDQVEEFKRGNPTFFGHDSVCPSSGLLSSANTGNIKRISDTLDSMSLCIYASMTTNVLKSSHGYNYTYCKGNSSTERAKVSPPELSDRRGVSYEAPCVTTELHETIVKSFSTVAQCVDVDEESYFPIVHHESRFQPNIGNNSGVYGISQLTGKAASDVNRFYLEEKEYKYDKKTKKSYLTKVTQKDFSFLRDRYAKKYGVGVESNENPCHRMRGTLFNPFKVDTPDQCYFKKKQCRANCKTTWCKDRNCTKRKLCDFNLTACERTAFPRNPLRALLYGALKHKKDLEKAEEFYGFLPLEAREKLNKKEAIRIIASYIYNGGEGDIETLMINYVSTKNYLSSVDKINKRLPKGSSRMRAYYENFSTDIFKSELEGYILHTGLFPSGAAKQAELGDYVMKIKKDKKQLQSVLKNKGFDVQCGI